MKSFILISFCCFCFLTSAQLIEKTLATVDSEMISLLELKETRSRLRQGFMANSTLLSLFKKSQLLKKNTALLKFIIYKKLLDNASLIYSPAVKSISLKKEVLIQRKNRKLSKKSFRLLLKKNNFTLASYKVFLKNSILREIFIQKELLSKIRLSEQDLNEYALQTQGKALFTSFKYELSYISFTLTKSGKWRAQKIIKKLKKDSSLFDKWQPHKKGDKKETLKPLLFSAIHPAIKNTIKKLSTGQTSSLLRLPTGYYIFKLLWKTPVITAKNKKRQTKLSYVLLKKRLKAKLQIWLEKKQKQSFVKINL